MHELIHAITFKILGYQIRLFCIGPFSVIKNKNGVCLKLGFNNTLGIGGIVIPDIPVDSIKNQRKIGKLRKNYSIAMIMAPLFSGLLAVFSCFAIFKFIYRVPLFYQSSLFAVCSTFLFTNIYIALQAFVSFGSIVGDFRAFYKYLKNEKFSICQILLYSSISTEKDEIRKNDFALRNRMGDILEREDRTACSTDTIIIADYFLYHNVLYNTPISENVLKYIEYLKESFEWNTDKLMFESYYITYIHLFYYMQKYEADGYLDMWEKLKIKIPKNRVGRYYLNQADRCLLGKVGIEEPSLENEPAVSSVDNVLGKLDHYYDDEILMNEIIDRKIRDSAIK